MNYEEEIEVCSINNIESRTYPITSAYLSIDEELKQGEKYNFNENEDLSYLTFEIKKGKAISLFINIKELKKLLGKNIYETAEYSFPYYIIVTLHVRDRGKDLLSREYRFGEHYTLNLISDKLIRLSNGNYCLNMKFKNGDKNFILEKANEGTNLYKIYPNNDE